MNKSNDIFKYCFMDSKVICCSVEYNVIICLLSGIRYILWSAFTFNWIYSKLLGAFLGLLWFVVIELFIILITAGFSYRIINKKRGIKRFFCFIHFKYFKYNLFLTMTYALFWGSCTFFVNYIRFASNPKEFSKLRVYISAFLLLIFKAFELMYAYFRAKEPNVGFNTLAKKYCAFLSSHLKGTINFVIKLFLWIIGYMLLIAAFRKTDFNMVIYVMLNSCLYGLGIFFFPFFMFSFDKFVRYLANE